MGEELPISVGVPQGSPISPILSIIFSAPVLHALNERLPSSSISPVLPRSYIDDFAFLSISDDLATNVNLLTESLIITQELLGDVGMTLDSSKSELMHFTPSYDPTAYIITSSPSGEEVIVRPAKKTLRWLGIFFDPRLSFSHHVTIMRNRGMTAVNGLRMLTNTVRGLGQRHLRIMVKTVVVTVLTYASVLWFNPHRRGVKGLVGSLQMVMNQASRLISGCFRTAPTHAKQILSHQPPLDITLNKLSTSAANRLLRLPFSALLSQRLPNSWRGGLAGSAPFPTVDALPHNSSTMSSWTCVEFLSSLSTPKGERTFPFTAQAHPQVPSVLEHPWFTRDVAVKGKKGSDERQAWIGVINNLIYNSMAHHDEPKLMFFCDGSARTSKSKPTHSRAGAGIASYPPDRNDGPKPGRVWALFAGKHTLAFDGEMLALSAAARHAKQWLVDHPEFSGIPVYFFSDSVAALSSIIDPTSHPGQQFSLSFIHTVKEILDDLHSPVHMAWSPGHAEIWGNELADAVANRAVGRTSRSIRDRLWRASDGRNPQLSADLTFIADHPAPHATTFHSSLAWLKAKAKRVYTSDWKHRIHNLPPSHLSPGVHFALHRDVDGDVTALRYPISVNPTSAFLHTPRELWARGAQALTGHGYIGSYYQRMKFDQSYCCPCSPDVVVQTKEHIVQHCPRYEAHRHILIEADEALLWDDWHFCRLGEPEVMLPALHDFCRKSGAFTKLGAPYHLNLILPPERPREPP